MSMATPTPRLSAAAFRASPRSHATPASKRSKRRRSSCSAIRCKVPLDVHTALPRTRRSLTRLADAPQGAPVSSR